MYWLETRPQYDWINVESGVKAQTISSKVLPAGPLKALVFCSIEFLFILLYFQCALCLRALQQHGEYVQPVREVHKQTVATKQHASQGPIQINTALEQEFMELGERLKQTESQLQHERIAWKNLEKRVKKFKMSAALDNSFLQFSSTSFQFLFSD